MTDTSSKWLRNDAVDMDLNAYNAAFYQLGLRWNWDRATYEQLLAISGAAIDRLRWYLRNHQAHLLTAYDADFLANVIESTKADRRKAMRASAAPSRSRCDWAQLGAAQVGV